MIIRDNCAPSLFGSAEELLTVIPRAFRIAASGRPGPVLVDIPKDVQNQLSEVREWPEPGAAEPAPAVKLIEKTGGETDPLSRQPIFHQ